MMDGSMSGVCIKQVRGKWELEEKEMTEYMYHFRTWYIHGNWPIKFNSVSRHFSASPTSPMFKYLNWPNILSLGIFLEVWDKPWLDAVLYLSPYGKRLMQLLGFSQRCYFLPPLSLSRLLWEVEVMKNVLPPLPGNQGSPQGRTLWKAIHLHTGLILDLTPS